VPQPGLLATLAQTGKLKAVPAAASANVDKYYSAAWKALGTVGGKFYAAPLDADVKSLVWYSPKTFAAKGYTVPTTWDQLIALSDKIAADNPGGTTKPWCQGFSSGAQSGWPGTDWLEDVMLRLNGPSVFDQWVSHKIAFNSAPVTAALAKVGEILKNPKYVNGGLGDVSSIATTTFQDAGQGILKGSCYLHRQSAFYGSLFPKGTDLSPTGDAYAFYFPSIDPAKGKPVLGSGDFVAAFSDRPEVAAFQAYLTSPDWVNIKAKAGGWLNPNSGLNAASLGSPVDKLAEAILQDKSTTVRFDGSDSMPAAVGSGSFLKGMVDWITGQSDKDTLDAIEASWPKS
jgi:alpha-glucoside transport system substrate-binding protein